MRALGSALAGALLCATPAAAAPPPGPLAPPAGAECAGARLLPSPSDLAQIDGATLCLINRIRVADGLRPLRANRSLALVAVAQAATMVRHDYFADVRPNGQTPLALVAASSYHAHAARFAVAQNIAWGTAAYATPAHIVLEWMASPRHRGIILTARYRDAGVGATPGTPAAVGAGGQGGTYAVEFGTRR